MSLTSGTPRARRAHSPQPRQSYPLQEIKSHSPAAAYPSGGSQRFPQAYTGDDQLDADARKQAVSRGYLAGKKSYPPGGLALSSGEWKLLGLVVLVGSAVRLFRLSRPNSVVFDEVHFGKFASRYIKTRYFVDVHPPLAKMLITLAGFIFGYDGDFDFKEIGKVYEHVPYVAMRMVPAILGVGTIPLAYLTLRALDCRATTALLASLFVTFENGLIVQSRHILLDSPLIFFTALTTFLWVGFCNEDKHQPFTNSWWSWLFLSGLSLGAVVSCKWVGLFTIATVGFSTIAHLWCMLGDVRVSMKTFARHFYARALCLIVVPVLFYMFMFQIHFMLLGSSGEGDGFMSSEFQHTLGGRRMADTFADVGFGSEVTIRHVNTQGGYLHSHDHAYPGGSKQQQITLYPHRDENNNWRIFNATDNAPDYRASPFTPLKTGVRIKLQHITTEKRLHSHDVRPPVSDVDFQNEVSGYGMPGFAGDANDDWILEIFKGAGGDAESWSRLRTLRSKFRLKHALTGCYLFSHKVKLPEWAYEQQEVTCNKNAPKANSLWIVETATHEKLPADAPKVNYKLPGFLAKFFELQQVMWTTNAGLTDRHNFDSRPQSWPLLRRGINFWVKDHRHIYLMGNPTIWWSSTAAVVAYAIVRGFLLLRAKRGYRDFDNTKVVKYDTLCGFLFLGWALHYGPFFLMGRQLFLHHYFPALYFAILLSCGVFDLATSALKPKVRLQIAGVVAAIAVWNFVYFSPLTYGGAWTRAKCERARWLRSWDFSCGDYFETYGQYSGGGWATPVKSSVPVATIGGERGGRGAIVVEDKQANISVPAPPAVPGENINAKIVDAVNQWDKEKAEPKLADWNDRHTIADLKAGGGNDGPKEAETTGAGEGVGAGQAEPGPDIFASEPMRDIKSEVTEVERQKERERKKAGAEERKAEMAAKEISSVSPSSTSGGAGDGSAGEGHSASKSVGVEAHPAGPMGEEEAEADRAAKELFGGKAANLVTAVI